MLKKLSAILLVFIIISISSVNVFAGQTEDSFSSAATTANNPASFPDSTTGAATSVEENTGVHAGAGKGTADGEKSDIGSLVEAELKNGKVIDNGEFVIEITSPDKDKDSTYEETYVLSGNTRHNDVVVVIARYNDETGHYERIKNTDGESSWEIGSIRIFTKEITLKKGTNKIMIISYRSSQKEEVTLDNVQFNCFTIEKLDKSIRDEIIKITKEAATNIGEGFKSFMDILGKKD